MDGTLNCNLEELAILRAIAGNPQITQKELMQIMEKSERTIKRRIKTLQEKGIIIHRGGKRTGKWELLTDIE